MLKLTLYVESTQAGAQPPATDLASIIEQAAARVQSAMAPQQPVPSEPPSDGSLNVTLAPWHSTSDTTIVRIAGTVVVASVEELLDGTYRWAVAGRGASGRAATRAMAMADADAALTGDVTTVPLATVLAEADQAVQVKTDRRAQVGNVLRLVRQAATRTGAPIPVAYYPQGTSGDPVVCYVGSVTIGEHPDIVIVPGDGKELRIPLRDARVHGGDATTALQAHDGALVFDDDALFPGIEGEGGPDPRHDLLRQGADAFGRLVATWAQNFGVEEAPQPDRVAALMTAFSGYARQVNAYIAERGGLGGACIDSVVRGSIAPPEEAVALGKRIARNMVQVGTTQGFPLDKFQERSMFDPDDPPDRNPHGGMVRDVVSDAERPPELGT